LPFATAPLSRQLAVLQGPLGNRCLRSHQKVTEQHSPMLLPGKEHGTVTLQWLRTSKGLDPHFEINLPPTTAPLPSGRIPPPHRDRIHSHLTGALLTRTQHVPQPWACEQGALADSGLSLAQEPTARGRTGLGNAMLCQAASTHCWHSLPIVAMKISWDSLPTS